MSDKYVVSQEFMNELEEWETSRNIVLGEYVDSEKISDLLRKTKSWWTDFEATVKESNNRLIAILRWVNGEDVFEVEKSNKWVVQSKETDSEDRHLYVNLSNGDAIPDITTLFWLKNATKFDTKEEAESWANSHQEVVEV